MGDVIRIPAARVVTAEGVVGPAVVTVQGAVVASVEPHAGPAPGHTLVPGLVDLQVNGLDHVDLRTADDAGWAHVGRRLLQAGVTTWCPTMVSSPLDAYGPFLDRVTGAMADPGADAAAVAGAHLEGPFLARPGAHDPAALRPPDLDWLGALPPQVRIVTLAPELAGAVDAVAVLAGRGVVVALGHTDADPGAMTAAVDAGARLVTHLFNGMPAFHHRRPGPAGAALVDDRVTVTLIADGEHVDPLAVRLAFRVKGPQRVALVSDTVADTVSHSDSASTTDGGTEPGSGARRRDDGTLRGAGLTLDGGVRTAVTAGVPLADAVAAATTTPAGLLGLPHCGAIRPGARADLVALDADLAVAHVWRAGVPVR